MESDDTLRDALQSASVLPEQMIKGLNIDENLRNNSAASWCHKHCKSGRTSRRKWAAITANDWRAGYRRTAQSSRSIATTTNIDSVQPAADQLQDQVNSDLPLCSRTASVEISRIDKNQDDRARLPSGHIRQSTSIEMLSMPLILATSFQKNLLIDLDAPSDLNIAVPSKVKEHRQLTTQADVGVVKKTPSSIPRSENLTERQPAVKNQNNGPR